MSNTLNRLRAWVTELKNQQPPDRPTIRKIQKTAERVNAYIRRRHTIHTLRTAYRSKHRRRR